MNWRLTFRQSFPAGSSSWHALFTWRGSIRHQQAGSQFQVAKSWWLCEGVISATRTVNVNVAWWELSSHIILECSRSLSHNSSLAESNNVRDPQLNKQNEERKGWVCCKISRLVQNHKKWRHPWEFSSADGPYQKSSNTKKNVLNRPKTWREAKAASKQEEIGAWNRTNRGSKGMNRSRTFSGALVKLAIRSYDAFHPQNVVWYNVGTAELTALHFYGPIVCGERNPQPPKLTLAYSWHSWEWFGLQFCGANGATKRLKFWGLMKNLAIICSERAESLRIRGWFCTPSVTMKKPIKENG